jgi:hypothetical protein
MNKGRIPLLVTLVCLLVMPVSGPAGEIYKVVDKDGNVTYTDQKPAEGAEPVELPPLSVVSTDIDTTQLQTAEETPGQEGAPPTIRELRRQFRDFAITQPGQEETFWGTANTVTVSWASSEPIPEDMTVTLYVDGQARDVSGTGSASLRLDRGEHRVYAELRDSRKRRVATTENVVFFVKQHSVNFGFNLPASTPNA